MDTQGKTVYKSRIDWWIWCMIVFTFVVIGMAAGDLNWVAIIYGIGLSLLFVVLIAGCWYEIEDEQLIIYQFFKAHKFPIKKIKVVNKTMGYLATAGMSRLRVSIKFADRSVMKSSMPLEISPKNRDAFIAKLKQINPDIIVEDN